MGVVGLLPQVRVTSLILLLLFAAAPIMAEAILSSLDPNVKKKKTTDKNQPLCEPFPQQ